MAPDPAGSEPGPPDDRPGPPDDHHHHHSGPGPKLTPTLGRRLVVTGLVVLAGAVVAVVVLWPRGPAPDLGTIPYRQVDATVQAVTEQVCPGVEALGDVACREVEVVVTSGPDEGRPGVFTVVETDISVPELGGGDRIVLRDAYDAPEEFRYGFQDFQRRTPLVLLAGAFAVAVVALGRWRGVRALVGLMLGLGVLVVFVVPALLRDRPAVAVALAAGVLVVGAALYLAHGVTPATTIAFLGAVASVSLVTVLAVVVLDAARVSGLADADSQVLSITASALDLRGLLVAGIVIGVLGSLDDVTVTQVSTVAALRSAAPGLSARELYRRAVAVGRDHVAASVNTLVLAYAGASLPLLLLFAQGGQPLGRLVTSEVVAVEVVRMLVGSIGVVMAVPLTTALAAVVLAGTPVVAREQADRSGSGPLWDDFGPDA